MDVNWLSIGLGWIGGIPTGIIANWVFNKYMTPKKPKGEYFTASISDDEIVFEGRTQSTASVRESAQNLLGIPVAKSTTRNIRGTKGQNMMEYTCPICGFKTEKAGHLASHMINAHNRFEEHWGWIESQGINFPQTLGLKGGKLGKGDYSALIEVIEKKCRASNT